MAAPTEPPALAHIEKTLADSYRKEIDQEENVWRTLPFFAATLALQLAALYQLADKMPGPETWLGIVALILLGLCVLLTFAALIYLAPAVVPRKFHYVANEPELLRYANDLIDYEALPQEERADQDFSALVTLKQQLATQYADAAHHNRQINKARELKRSMSGLLIIGSMILTVLLVIAVESQYVANKFQAEATDVRSSRSQENSKVSSGGRSSTDGTQGQKACPATAADASGDKGRLGDARGGVSAGPASAGQR